MDQSAPRPTAAAPRRRRFGFPHSEGQICPPRLPGGRYESIDSYEPSRMGEGFGPGHSTARSQQRPGAGSRRGLRSPSASHWPPANLRRTLKPFRSTRAAPDKSPASGETGWPTKQPLRHRVPVQKKHPAPMLLRAGSIQTRFNHRAGPVNGNSHIRDRSRVRSLHESCLCAFAAGQSVPFPSPRHT